jgi:hypothetical protein
VLSATGRNLRRLGAWWDERPFAPTRTAAFLALAPAASPGANEVASSIEI